MRGMATRSVHKTSLNACTARTMPTRKMSRYAPCVRKSVVVTPPLDSLRLNDIMAARYSTTSTVVVTTRVKNGKKEMFMAYTT